MAWPNLTNRQYFIGLIWLGLFCSFPLSANEFTLSQPTDGGLRISHQSVEIIRADYVGWQADWQWADTQLHAISDYQSSATVPALDLRYERITEVDNHQFVQHYRFAASKVHNDAIGYGLSFKLHLNSPSFQGAVRNPVLLPENTGWRWQATDKSVISVSFFPPLKRIFLEPGNPGEIRALFFEDITTGVYRYTMTLSINGVPQPSVMFSPPPATTANWPADTQSWQTSAVDLSFLNANHKPAGRHGFIEAIGEDLQFANGEPARFWGTNLQAYALFMTDDFNIQQQAKRIAKLGFNLVRIHHHDSQWVTPNIFKNPAANTLTLNELALKKLDWWIKCLKEEGIYIWLDLQVERAYTAGDGIPLFQEVAKNQPFHHLKGFNYFNVAIQQRMIEFNSHYLAHINPFTKLAYQDDPAIVGVTLTNENDVTHHFGNALQADKQVPQHHQLFLHDVATTGRRLALDPNAAWQSWTFGDAKIYLNDVEHRFNQTLITPLRKAGLKNLIVTTNSWGGMSLAGLPSLTDGDVVDVHNYGRANEVQFNPRYRGGMLAWIGAAQVTGKPLVVSEWNLEKFPVADRQIVPTWLAAIASLQGWDGMMLYGYSQSALNTSHEGSNYSSYNDPSLIAMMPAAALLYRQQHLAAAQHHYRLQLPAAVFFGQEINADTSATIRTLMEQSKLTVDVHHLSQLPWLNKLSSGGFSKTKADMLPLIITDPHQDYIQADQQFVASDTGQIKRDWQNGVLTIDSPQSQIVAGNISKTDFQLSATGFAIDTSDAVVAVQSLSAQSIQNSSQILISKIGRSLPVSKPGSAFVVEPIIGKISIQAPAGLHLYSLNANGERQQQAFEYADGVYQITLLGEQHSPWLVLQ